MLFLGVICVGGTLVNECAALELLEVNSSVLRLNTSNVGKLEEFRRLFLQVGLDLEASSVDLAEIDADPISVVVHKASHVDEGVLIEDTSLDIDGADVGVNIRWLIDNLEQLEGCEARWTCLLAQRVGDMVYVYEGQVTGTIVQKRGDGGFGFDPYFLPHGRELTLAQAKPDDVNARALAVDAFVFRQVMTSADPIFDWDGGWQHD